MTLANVPKPLFGLPKDAAPPNDGVEPKTAGAPKLEFAFGDPNPVWAMDAGLEPNALLGELNEACAPNIGAAAAGDPNPLALPLAPPKMDDCCGAFVFPPPPKNDEPPKIDPPVGGLASVTALLPKTPADACGF